MGHVDFTALSDKRFKYNIKQNVPGLDFIMKLEPVTYQFDIDKFHKFKGIEKIPNSTEFSNEQMDKVKSMVKTGFLAQDVEAAANSIGYDFYGVDRPDNPDENNYGLRYSTFVVPLIKAVQEQQTIIKNQEAEINTLKERLKKIETFLNEKF